MANTEKYTTVIQLNSEQAQKEISKLEDKIENLKKKREEALKAGNLKSWNKLGKEIEKDNKQLDLMRGSLKKINDTIANMSAAGPKDLRDTIKAINQLLNDGSVQRGSQTWDELTTALGKARTELRAIQIETAAQQSMWGKFTKFLNDSWGGVTMIIGSITGLSMTIRSVVKAYSDMEQEMANVRKYTGQTAEEVERMNEDFKRMDTRTAREELNQLAVAAGRLGITETKLVEEFVDGADKINVALGDDLGQGAVDTIGKLAIAFGEDKTKGLRGAMLATGSALNELVQSSPAQAQPIIEFTSKLSGVGQQAHLAQAQIMGIAAALDQNNQEMATSSTVMNQLITKMYQDPARFAKMAGMEVESFAKKVKEDMNGALMEWLQNVNKLGDMSVLASKFEELKMDGTRAVGVLATLAGHVDQVAEAQRTATKAYEEGTSVINEFNVQNETVQAKTEKAKKRFHDLTIELGEKLLPVVKYTINGSSMLVKALSALITWVGKYRTTLLVLIATMAMWKLETIATITLHKTLNPVIEAVVAACKKLWTIVKANPWGALLTVLALVIARFVDYRRKINDARDAQKALNDVRKTAEKRVHEEVQSIERLIKSAKDEKKSLEDRQRAIDKLNQIIPDYNAQLDKTTGKYIENKKALDNYIVSLRKRLQAEAAAEKLKELYRQKADLEEKEEEQSSAYWKQAQNNALHGYKPGFFDKVVTPILNEITPWEFGEGSEAGLERSLKNTRNDLRKIDSMIEKIESRIENIPELVDNINPVSPIINPDNSDTDTKDDKQLTKEEAKRQKQLKERADAAKAEYQAEVAEEMLAYRQGITTYTHYMEERHQITQNYYDEMKRIYGEDSTEYKKLLDNREREEADYIQWTAKKKQDELTRERAERDRSIRKQFNDEKSYIYHNQDGMQEALFQSEITYLKQRQNLYKNGSKEWMDLEMQIQDKNRQHQFELEQDFIQRLAKYREEAGQKNLDDLMQIELKGLEFIKDALIAAGKMTEEEYDQIAANIKRKYDELKANQAADNDVSVKASKSLDTAKKMAGVKGADAGSDAVTGIYSMVSIVQQRKLVNEKLKELYGEDYQNNKEYQEAKRQLNVETMQGIVAGAQAAYSTISSMMSAVSSLAQANSDLEVAKITKNYDKQIQAAGKNEKKKKKLEEQRDKEIAAAKTKANKKAMAIELAQAVASTAMAAINAYSSAAQVPLIGYILGPIAAAMALASGAIQIATIKKQHQVEAMGYYEGGFTGGKRYRREAGVVHEGEFVANHQAVQNPAVLPFLNFLDQAQRNNTVGSLTMQDVSRAAGGGTATVVAPVVNVQTDNSELQETLTEAREVIGRLATQLENGIGVDIPIAGENGVYRKIKQYENLLKNK